MGIQLTEKAVSEIRRIMSDQKLPSTTGLRVGVKGGGCSGFSYALGFDPQSREGDQIETIQGIPVFCDSKSHLYLNGIIIDFQDSLMGRGFVFQNPNAKHTCGCGESFSV